MTATQKDSRADDEEAPTNGPFALGSLTPPLRLHIADGQSKPTGATHGEGCGAISTAPHLSERGSQFGELSNQTDL